MTCPYRTPDIRCTAVEGIDPLLVCPNLDPDCPWMMELLVAKEKAEADLALNAAMLARQTDMAREAETREMEAKARVDELEQALQFEKHAMKVAEAMIAAEKARWAALRKRCEDEVDPYRDGPRLLERDEYIVRGFMREMDALSTNADVVRVVVEHDHAMPFSIDGKAYDPRLVFDDGDVLYLVRMKEKP